MHPTHDTGACIRGGAKKGHLLLCMYVGKDIFGFAHVWRKEGSERDCCAGGGARRGGRHGVVSRPLLSLPLPPSPPAAPTYLCAFFPIQLRGGKEGEQRQFPSKSRRGKRGPLLLLSSPPACLLACSRIQFQSSKNSVDVVSSFD